MCPAHGEKAMATTVEMMTTSETADTPRPKRLTRTHGRTEEELLPGAVEGAEHVVVAIVALEHDALSRHLGRDRLAFVKVRKADDGRRTEQRDEAAHEIDLVVGVRPHQKASRTEKVRSSTRLHDVRHRPETQQLSVLKLMPEYSVLKTMSMPASRSAAG